MVDKILGGKAFTISVEIPSMPKLDLGFNFFISAETSLSDVIEKKAEDED